MDRQIGKQDVHALLQDEARQHAHIGAEAFLTRWIVIRELAVPIGGLRLAVMSGDASGRSLHTWEAMGFHLACLTGLNPGQLVDRVQPPDEGGGPGYPF